MSSETLVCIDNNVFDEMISEIQHTRAQLENSLAKSEKTLKKLCKLKTQFIVNCDRFNLNDIENDKQS
jgi:hypothetical protein